MTASWDETFLKMANDIANKTRCLSRGIGAVIVKNGKYPVSFGYNGPPMNFPNPDTGDWHSFYLDSGLLKSDELDHECPRRIMGFKSGEAKNFCPCAHAERNAIDIAARLGVGPLDGCTMYLSCPIPCFDCALSIVQAGIKAVVVIDLIDYEPEGITGGQILENSGVSIRTYNL